MSNLIQLLKECVGDTGLITGSAMAEHPACVYMQPKAIVRPASTIELSRVMQTCHQHNQPVVSRGGGSGLVAGTVVSTDEVLLSLERMNQIEELDTRERTMTVQAGVVLQLVQEAAAEQGLFFPLDLGARGSATIGGNIATNAGGNRVVRYGMVREMVLGLESVLADGTIVESMKSVVKNNTGYDLKQLFIGSEGTLGIVSRAVLRLQSAPLSHNTALVAVDSFDKLIDLLSAVDQQLGGTMSSFEVMWQNYYQHVCHGGDRHRMPLSGDYPFYIIIESMGANQEADSASFERALENLFEKDLIIDAVLAKSKTEIASIWAIRDDVEALMDLFPYFVFDVSLPLKHMEAYVKTVESKVHSAWPDDCCCISFGHLGDGNLHFVIRADGQFDEVREQVNGIVYGELRAFQGVISAEHGIGMEKRAYLDVSRNEIELELMKTLKRTLDPKGILNPGKIFE